MKAVYVLADGELDHALALQLHDGHVCGRGEGFNQGDGAAGFRRCLVLRLQLPHPGPVSRTVFIPLRKSGMPQL